MASLPLTPSTASTVAKLAHEAVGSTLALKRLIEKFFATRRASGHTTSPAHRRNRSVSSTLIISCRSYYRLLSAIAPIDMLASVRSSATYIDAAFLRGSPPALLQRHIYHTGPVFATVRTFLELTDWSAGPVHGLRDFIACFERPKARIRLGSSKINVCAARSRFRSARERNVDRRKRRETAARFLRPVDPPLNAVSPEEGLWQNWIGTRGSDLRWQRLI